MKLHTTFGLTGVAALGFVVVGCGSTATDDSDPACEIAVLSEPAPDSPLGFLFSFYHGEHDPDAASPDFSTVKPLDDPPYSVSRALGSRWERVSEPILNWTFIQSTPEAIQTQTFDWSIPDNFLLQIPPGNNIVVNLIPGDVRLVPGKWKFSAAPLDDAWAAFVQHAVERYDGDRVDDAPGLVNPIKHWQLDNEPMTKELRSGECVPGGGELPKVCLNTDHAGYAALFRRTVEAAKAADSEALILPGGVVSVPLGDIDDFVFESFWSPLFADLSGFPLDGFDLHWFGAWEALPDQFRRYRAALNAGGFETTAIWMTELGSASHLKGERWQAADHTRRFALGLGLGARNVFRAWALVEGWPPFDCISEFEYTGLVYDGRCDGDPGWGVPKLAYYSYALFSRVLGRTNWPAVTLFRDGRDGVYAVRFPTAGNATTLVVWSAGEETVSTTLSTEGASCATLTNSVPRSSAGTDILQSERDMHDLSGLFDRRTVEITTGEVTFDVGPEPLFLEFR